MKLSQRDIITDVGLGQLSTLLSLASERVQLKVTINTLQVILDT